MNQAKIRKIIKEETQKYLKEFDIPRTPEEEDKPLGELPKGYGSTGLDPEETEPSTLGLEEAETSHASVQQSLGAGRSIEEVWISMQSSVEQAHKDLQMLAIHLGNAKSSTKEVDDAVDTLERMRDMLNQDVVNDVRKIAYEGDVRGGRNPGGSIGE
tara:strand:+ start:66 stop:536 length:471 start_codon:yes stop_codon:yes gene_type:complete